jgi:hypothetical protein
VGSITGLTILILVTGNSAECNVLAAKIARGRERYSTEAISVMEKEFQPKSLQSARLAHPLNRALNWNHLRHETF